MPWPHWIPEQFAAISGNLDALSETFLYGPYNSMLLHLFPPQEGFMVVPQYQRPRYRESLNFTTVFVVHSTQTKSPIFYLVINPPNDLKSLLSREEADRRTRDCAREIIDHIQIPKLYGVSAMGTQPAFYCYNSETNLLLPPAFPHDLNRVNDTAPAARWSENVLSNAGYQRLAQLAMMIKNM